ncbi:MAG: hypothetical protein OXT68_11035 [Chloroflexota bacterium]|nr:hypothetical protein [Chloroflexota bacterium]
MSRKYSLDNKIDALNQIDQYDGDVAVVSDLLGIPKGTLRDWQRAEGDLRDRQRQRQSRQRDRLMVDLQLGMLERCQAILRQMNSETLAKAPLNQLTSALGTLVNHALKLEEAIEEIDEQEEEKEKVIRFEYFYDGAVQEVPPWTGASEGFDRSLQSSGVWEALGQDRAWQDDTAAPGAMGEEAYLVAGADSSDGEPGLAGLESEREGLAQPGDQRERTPH